MDFGENIGIEQVFAEKGSVKLKLPLTDKVKQPFGFLHGGVSVALAEQAASVGAIQLVAEDEIAFGLEINANHIKSIREGTIYALAEILHAGQTTQVWQVKIESENSDLIAICRVTMAVKKKRAK
ncbi:1,4-dihydroxy-2-naphthoyl-CoA hydrolase MenI [Listeria fleischmannii]|jgi:1,4-dihydroxy-2-naphthoyl-CoA hydrolase|uniref:PaaI family thioesterase n=2 Tax=Listeria fleischmannii TaxID=1069827 RepID=A0A841YEC7_9LIST|nr:PaaI family thioesterase [Listeria fleischmannii]EUJ62858.1 putative esterase ComA2 [Listeria fleischmannii FSL S10-1203]MBC1398593.1 PaaI family thioesterase [Listeria fleischmannii]MBC1426654.1 PaaI family thioesterase [Listeria fleischmannii]